MSGTDAVDKFVNENSDMSEEDEDFIQQLA